MSDILFVLYHDFSVSSAIHVHNIANLLVKKGHRCSVAVPQNKKSVTENFSGDILYEQYDFKDTVPHKVDIIHAWTPREIVRKYCLAIKKDFPSAKLVIHLEDNEELIAESYTDVPYKYLSQLGSKRSKYLLSDLVISPAHYREFLKSADGVTVITDELFEFVPKGIHSIRLWPAIDLHRFSPEIDGKRVRKKLGISEEQFVLCYIGSVHGVNAREVKSLYLAVYLANRHGISVRLIRAGRDVVDFPGEGADEINPYIINLGYVDMEVVPGLMAAADMLIQPGRVDRFNRYRLPSKIPEFLASGKPVALPHTNIGLFLEDGYNCLLMKEGDTLAIFKAIQTVVDDPEFAARIGRGGREFAEEHFAGEIVLKKLNAFYKTILKTQ